MGATTETEARALRHTSAITSVVVADDQYAARLALRDVLSGGAHLRVIGEATNGHEALALCRDIQPDLLLVDVRMPDIDGLTVTRTMKRERPAMRVIVVSLDGEPLSVIGAMRTGADGFIMKGTPRRQLLAAVRHALRDKAGVHPLFAECLVSALCANASHNLLGVAEALTEAECEILRLRAAGHSHRAIARLLHVPASEVLAHLTEVNRKLGVPASAAPE